MLFHAVLLSKPIVYFGVLAAGATRLCPPEVPRPGALRLGLLALARTLAGMALGPLVYLGAANIANHSEVVAVVALGLVGFGLWVLTGKLAFRSARQSRLLAFAAAAEGVSLGMDFLLGQFASELNIRMC